MARYATRSGGRTPTRPRPTGLLEGIARAILARRHLDESQRAMIADKITTLKRGQTKTGGEADSPIGLSQPDAARLVNVGLNVVKAARVVREQATPELVQAVEQA